jgi:hypothetical protein
MGTGKLFCTAVVSLCHLGKPIELTAVLQFLPCPYINQNSSKPIALLVTCFALISCLAYYLTPKMEVTCSSKTSIDFKWITWCYIPELFITTVVRILNPTKNNLFVVGLDSAIHNMSMEMVSGLPVTHTNIQKLVTKHCH